MRAWQLASRTLGRRAATAADFAEAFTLEWIDLLAAIPDPAALLGLGRNRVGPADGLYVIDEGAGLFRVYRQERRRQPRRDRGLSSTAPGRRRSTC